jgi:hypothetical protein
MFSVRTCSRSDSSTARGSREPPHQRSAPLSSFAPRIVERDVDHERNGAIERLAEGDVKRFGHVDPVFERELGDLRVR